MGFSAVAALASASEVTATMVLSAMTEVGLAATVVGAVTGSKDLMKVGGVLSLVGGVGGMVNGAMGAASTTSDLAAQGDSINALDKGANYAGNVATDTAASVAAAAPAATAFPEGGMNTALDAAGNVTNQSLANGGAQTQGALNANAAGAPGAIPNPQASTNSSIFTGGDMGVAPTGTASTAAPGATPTGTATDAATNTVQGNSSNALDKGLNYNGAPVQSSNYFDKILNFVKGNDKVSAAIIQAGSGVLSGMSQASINDKKMAMEQQKINQTSYGSQVANYARPQGIISTARA